MSQIYICGWRGSSRDRDRRCNTSKTEKIVHLRYYDIQRPLTILPKSWMSYGSLLCWISKGSHRNKSLW